MALPTIKRAVKKKVSSSKNRKKGWKRHSNVADIEEHLEERRKDAIAGGSTSEKANENLFYIERKPVKKIESSAQKKLRRQNALQHLRCFRSLENDSKVEPPVKPPNASQRFKIRIKQPNPRKLAKLVERDQIIADNRIKLARERQHLRVKQLHMEADPYDLWNPQDAPLDYKPEKVIGDERLDNYYKEQTRRKVYKVPINRSLKPSALDAVEVPHPGSSYNPAYDDHQELLRKAVEVKERKIREKMKLRRSLNRFFPRGDQAPNEETWLQEMSQGLIDDGRSDNEGEIDCSLPLSLNPAIRAENRKSAKKRRRQARHEKLLDEAKKRKALAKQENQVARIGVLKSELRNLTVLYAERKRQRKAKQRKKAFLPSRLSKHKYEAPDPEVNLSNDLKGSFRLLKMEGSLLFDRYKSLQRRNIIATQSTQKVRQKKLKRIKYTRKGHAEPDQYFNSAN